MEETKIQVSLLELITLREIEVKYHSKNMDIADSVISVLKKVSQLNPDTSIQEMEEMQEQLRAMMNNVEEEIKVIADDKAFVKKIVERADKITPPSAGANALPQ